MSEKETTPEEIELQRERAEQMVRWVVNKIAFDRFIYNSGNLVLHPHHNHWSGLPGFPPENSADIQSAQPPVQQNEASDG